MTAARLGYALAQQFDALRGRMSADTKRPGQVVLRESTGNDVLHYLIEWGPGGRVFQCFRHMFISAADRANVPESRHARLTGHSQGGSVLHGHYIDVPTLPELATAVCSVKFDLPSIKRYRPGQFEMFQ